LERGWRHDRIYTVLWTLPEFLRLLKNNEETKDLDFDKLEEEKDTILFNLENFNIQGYSPIISL
jgi:hypothetical protein